MDGLGPINVGFVHEQSPWTTHNGFRFTVEALSGGFSTRIVTASVNYIRRECGKCPGWLLDKSEGLRGATTFSAQVPGSKGCCAGQSSRLRRSRRRLELAQKTPRIY